MWLHEMKANFYAKVPSITSKIIEYYLPRPFANAWLKIEIDKDIIVLRNNYTTKPLSNMHLSPLLKQTVKSSLEKIILEKIVSRLEKLTYIFKFCHHENRKTWPKWDVIDSEKYFVFVEIFQDKKDKVWKNITGEILWNT